LLSHVDKTRPSSSILSDAFDAVNFSPLLASELLVWERAPSPVRAERSSAGSLPEGIDPPGVAVEERPFRAALRPSEELGFSPCRSPHNRSQSANAFGVDTPTFGVTTTHATAGKSGSGYTCCPRPTPSTVPPTRNNGKSDPTSAAMRSFSAAGKTFFSALSSPSKVATAFAEAAPPPALHRQPLVDLDDHASFRAQRSHSLLNDAEAGIGIILRHARVSAPNLDSIAAFYAHLNHIMQPDRLIHRQQFVESVVPRRANAQPEIDFRERSHGHAHGGMIVNSRLQIYDAGIPSSG
jgi:hypothetical protein